jgi:protein-tyrosine-phosphatase
MQIDILFLDIDHSVSRLAETLSRRYITNEMEVDSAGLEPVTLSDEYRKKISEISGIVCNAEGKQVPKRVYTIVVTIGKSELFPVLPGVPATLNWTFDFEKDTIH